MAPVWFPVTAKPAAKSVPVTALRPVPLERVVEKTAPDRPVSARRVASPVQGFKTAPVVMRSIAPPIYVPAAPAVRESAAGFRQARPASPIPRKSVSSPSTGDPMRISIPVRVEVEVHTEEMGDVSRRQACSLPHTPVQVDRGCSKLAETLTLLPDRGCSKLAEPVTLLPDRICSKLAEPVSLMNSTVEPPRLPPAEPVVIKAAVEASHALAADRVERACVFPAKRVEKGYAFPADRVELRSLSAAKRVELVPSDRVELARAVPMEMSQEDKSFASVINEAYPSSQVGRIVKSTSSSSLALDLDTPIIIKRDDTASTTPQASGASLHGISDGTVREGYYSGDRSPGGLSCSGVVNGDYERPRSPIVRPAIRRSVSSPVSNPEPVDQFTRPQQTPYGVPEDSGEYVGSGLVEERMSQQFTPPTSSPVLTPTAGYQRSLGQPAMMTFQQSEGSRYFYGELAPEEPTVRAEPMVAPREMYPEPAKPARIGTGIGPGDIGAWPSSTWGSTQGVSGSLPPYSGPAGGNSSMWNPMPCKPVTEYGSVSLDKKKPPTDGLWSQHLAGGYGSMGNSGTMDPNTLPLPSGDYSHNPTWNHNHVPTVPRVSAGSAVPTGPMMPPNPYGGYGINDNSQMAATYGIDRTRDPDDMRSTVQFDLYGIDRTRDPDEMRMIHTGGCGIDRTRDPQNYPSAPQSFAGSFMGRSQPLGTTGIGVGDIGAWPSDEWKGPVDPLHRTIDPSQPHLDPNRVTTEVPFLTVTPEPVQPGIYERESREGLPPLFF